MVYLYKIKKGGQIYYSLRKSIRNGRKIYSKHICYIGKDLSKISFNAIREKYGNDVKNLSSIRRTLEYSKFIENSKEKFYREGKYLTREQSIDLDAIISHLKKMGNPSKRYLIENIKINFIHESTLIEENSLTLKEKRGIINGKISLKNKSIKEIYEVDNTNRIFNYLNKNKPKINCYLVKRINKDFAEGIGRVNGFRIQNIKIPQRKVKLTSKDKLDSELKKLICWFNKNKTKIHPLALAVLFHHKFEKIHPFLYGNGEIGRILLNYILSQSNYIPIVIPARKKEEYFKALDKADKAVKKDLLSTDMRYYDELMNFMCKCFVKTYQDNLPN